MTALFDIYLTRIRITIAMASQYRVDMAMQLIGKFAEPVIYLVVWSTIARQSGGEVAGYSVPQFAGYFIAWTLVRQMTVGWDPYYMERRIRQGEFTPLLLRPIHPYHPDTADMIGWKIIELTTVVPTMLILTLLFHPQLSLQGWAVAAFVPALLIAFVLRYTLLYIMAILGFWTTRVTALFNLLFAIEFLLGGRMAPLETLPPWAQTLADFLPWKWMFAFPLELVIGRLTVQQALFGFAMQALWGLLIFVTLILLWQAAVRRYSAVGG
jgi:ABC-2 type transport system permease protein